MYLTAVFMIINCVWQRVELGSVKWKVSTLYGKIFFFALYELLVCANEKAWKPTHTSEKVLKNKTLQKRLFCTCLVKY